MKSDRRNIEIYFKRYYGALCYFASQYIEQQSDIVVEDIVQDCFVKILEKNIEFESEDHLRNHLYMAVKNNCLNHIQKNKLRENHSDYVLSTQHEAECNSECGEEMMTAEVVRHLMEQIDNLPKKCGKIIKMSYFDGMDNQTVARLLGMSINTVRAQKMRGKKLLKANMGKVAL